MLTKILPNIPSEKRLVKVIGTTCDTSFDLNYLFEKANKIENNVSKRLLDIVITLLATIFVFSWLFPVLIILIKLSSKGPVFFKQERHGVDNKIFYCFKFRTMKPDSEHIDENGKFLQASANDDRITEIGSFLRRTSLDELPQFFNVLMSDMSIVGPRPHAILMNNEAENTIDGYNLRHLVRPGITGLSQVSGLRGETKEVDTLRMRVESDIKYIEVWDNALDIQIIFKTAKNILVGEENAF
ncbi:MAG: sugar transferase [Deinococcales bacterium]|nr:sugar transferase [Chitinophagaceae bacterium]